MIQIMNITDVRNNLGMLVKDVAQKDKTVVIIRDSLPEAVLIPYEKYAQDEDEKENIWQLRFERLLREGKKAGLTWAKKNKINLRKLSEEEKYDLIEKI